MIAKVSIGAGLRVSGSGSDDQATNQVGTRQESHDHPFAHTGKRSTSLALIRLATSVRVWSSERHSTARAIASFTRICFGSPPRCAWVLVGARNSPLLVRCR